MLEVSSLSLGFGHEVLLNNISLHLHTGELLVIRGANGIGKSSFLHVLSGIKEPLSGNVFLSEEPVSTHANRANILFLGHDLGLTMELTLEEQLQRFQLYYAIDAVDLERFYLTGLESLPVSQLSAGQRRRLWLSVLAGFRGQLVLLDEPFLALDVQARKLLEEIIESYKKQKYGVIVVATHMQENVKFCSQEIELSLHVPQSNL